MADLTITASSVVAGGNAVVTNGVAGASVTAGQMAYTATDGSTKLADGNLPGAELPVGVTLNAAGTGQRVATAIGDVTIGATLTPGTFYFLSANTGGICPVGDLTTGDRVVMVGYAKSASVLHVHIVDTGVTL